MHVLGGSLLQVLIPLIFAGYFFLRGDYYSAAIILLWAGQSAIDVSIYAADAVNLQLPLLGGDGVIHDWNWILSRLHLLNYTNVVAGTIKFMGILAMVAGSIFSVKYAFNSEISTEKNSAEKRFNLR